MHEQGCRFVHNWRLASSNKFRCAWVQTVTSSKRVSRHCTFWQWSMKSSLCR